MHNKPLERRTAEEIQAAIDRAKTYAAEQDVPLTVERLAAELDMDLGLFRQIMEGTYPVASKTVVPKVALIQQACGEATASVVEHAMRRGSSTNMHMLYLKNNAGYDRGVAADRKSETAAEDKSSLPVIFVGEEDISE